MMIPEKSVESMVPGSIGAFPKFPPVTLSPPLLSSSSSTRGVGGGPAEEEREREQKGEEREREI